MYKYSPSSINRLLELVPNQVHVHTHTRTLSSKRKVLPNRDAPCLLVHQRAGGLPKQDNRVRDPKAGGSNLSLPQCTPPDGSALVLTMMSPWGLHHIARQHDLMIMASFSANLKPSRNEEAEPDGFNGSRKGRR